jgi:hypothetical protein
MPDERVKRFWTLTRLVEQAAASMTCDLHTTDGGFEVRCHDGTAVVKSERVATVADAMNLCEAWKAAFHVQGWTEPSA